MWKGLAASVLVTFTCGPRPAFGQQSSTPVVASLVAHPPSNKTSYHVGEEIPLDLEFRATGDKDYYFWTGICGFPGRMMSNERIAVSPTDGTEDPLAEYFASAGGMGGSCPGSGHAPDGTPFDVRLSLNDAVRFTRPGTYRVVVTSTRLQRYSTQPAPMLTSTPVDLRIVAADDAWAAGELTRATDLVERGTQTDVRHGAAILRYLGTSGAAQALVDHYDVIADAGGEIQAALISSPYRARIVTQMEVHLDAGGALHSTFLGTLTWLRVLQELPPAPGDAAARRDRSALVQAAYDTRWRAALTRQPATATTLSAELARLPNASDELRQQIANDLDQHPAEAADAFVALPATTQWTLLNAGATGSGALRGPWVLPALRRMYAQWHADPSGLPAADLALTRLFALAPDEGRRLILEEIRPGERGIGYDALAILPDASLPARDVALDVALEERYTSPRPTDTADIYRDRGTTAWLIARYGSPALLPFVTDLLARGVICTVEGGLTTYLLAHDPAAAMTRLDSSLGSAPRDGCVAPLRAVVAHYWDDRVESAAIAQLHASDIMRVIDAAQALGSHGSRAAKQALLDRLTAWSDQWRGHAAELVPGAGVDSPTIIENNVVNALFQNKAFALTNDETARIRGLCVTDQCRSNVDGLMRARGLE